MKPDLYLKADVAVIGAGTAGTVAAMAAAEQGCDVLLVEQSGGPGGSGVAALVTPPMHTGIEGNPMCSYLSDEINRRMVKRGAASGAGDSYMDPVALAFVLEDMLAERGVRVLYHAYLCDAHAENGRVQFADAACKSGVVRVEAGVFIDATGDADLCARAGLAVDQGDENGRNQPVSLRYMVGGVDLDAFYGFLDRMRSLQRPGEAHEALNARPEQFCDAVTLGGMRHALDSAFAAGVASGDLENEDALYWQFFTVPGRPDALAMNCPEFFDEPDACDALALSRVQVRGKRAISRQMAFYRKSLPGFERAYIASVAGMVGVRESRRARTEYTLTAADAISHRKFPDAVFQSNYPVDVHGRVLYCETMEGGKNTAPYYEAPLGCLIVKHVDNLLVAGRCLGAEFIAQASARIIPSCRAMGEAAGVAAAMAIRQDTPVRAVDGVAVFSERVRRGAVFAKA